MRKRRKRRHFRLFIFGAIIAVLALIIYAAIVGCNSMPTKKQPDVSRALSLETENGVLLYDTTSPLAEHEPLESLTESEPEFISLGVFRITAYCPCVKCCEIWSSEHPSRIGTGYIQKTASGTIPTAGRTIAVDTSVISFGTTVFINGHEYVAEDRGGTIRGNRADIFFDSHQKALNFGVQQIEVLIRNPNYEGGNR